MDYSQIILIPRERTKLFAMRFIQPVSANFLGKDCYNLEFVYKFVYSNYQFVDTVTNSNPAATTYRLTDNYRRYCAWKRKCFFDSKLWELIISIVAAVLASLITNYLLK